MAGLSNLLTTARDALTAQSYGVGVTAQAYGRAAQATRPSDPRPLVGLSQISLLTGSAQDALKLALDAVRLAPSDASANSRGARAAGHLEHPDAFTAWRLAAGLAPDDVSIATELARCAAERGDYAFGVAVRS